MMVSGVRSQNGKLAQQAIRERNLSGLRGPSLLNRIIIQRVKKLKFLKRLKNAHLEGEIVTKRLIGLLAHIQTKRKDDLQILI
jgi:hypothetical protein